MCLECEYVFRKALVRLLLQDVVNAPATVELPHGCLNAAHFASQTQPTQLLLHGLQNNVSVNSVNYYLCGHSCLV